MGALLAIFIMQLFEDGGLGTAAIVTGILVLIAGSVAAMLFRLPLYAFFGLHAAGARLTGSLLEGMSEDSPGRNLFLYQHSFFLYGLGRFEEALDALEESDSKEIPEPLQSVVCLNKGLVQNALFRAGEAMETLSWMRVGEGYSNNLHANWLACTAEARAQLGQGLDLALEMAEKGFSLVPSPRIAVILGHVLLKMQHYDAAEAWVAWGMARVKRKERYFRSYARFLKAGILRETGFPSDADSILQKAIQLAPSDECRLLFTKAWQQKPEKRKRRQG
jgi:tetratricopeptide (TPR) repeat protein